MFYLDLFAALQTHGVDYVLVGGLALNIHGVERATMDVDLMLALDEDNLERFVEAARGLGLKPMLPLPIDELLQPEKRRDWVEQRHMIAFALHADQPAVPTVDVLIAPPIPFAEVFAGRVVRQVGRTAISLASIDDLIRLKQSTGRQRDAADAEALLRLQELGRA
ncbi:MAG: hypothetical protein AW08_02557 [Candidatus Accumulibacter adjunctus]|uniref:Uncharacterized protein n=1 Tax=Candidatus Accumulibacter adjunctus TaxID=1454001 RepID=A0A011M9Q6_9PROT|nr:MAG: hypothetical protein AW08_02557 [Candidatus Accumulibacter adjunctus]